AKVLSDHKQEGKVLVSPLTQAIGPLREISWIRTILPEIVWIALLHDSFGDRKAVEIITLLARKARSVKPDANSKWLAAASQYSAFSSNELADMRTELREEDILEPLSIALRPLITWYPDCPLSFLADEVVVRRRGDIARLKEIVSSLYARSSRGPMMAQATA